MYDEADGPEADQDRESAKCHPDGIGIWAVVRVKIGLHGIVEDKKHQAVRLAAEPREARTQKFQSLSGTIRAQPILLVGKIDQLDGKRFDDAGNAKNKQRGDNRNADEKPEKNLFRLPAIGVAISIEMRSDDVGQLCVDRKKIDGRDNREQHEQQFRKARVQCIL